MASGHEWKSLSGNYEDFQRELDNTASGVEFINQMMKEFHQIEVRLFKLLTLTHSIWVIDYNL